MDGIQGSHDLTARGGIDSVPPIHSNPNEIESKHYLSPLSPPGPKNYDPNSTVMKK